jgi:Fe-S cluster biogenesis protein NfuA
VTGTRYTTRHANGLPELADLHRLNVLTEKVVRAIEAVSPAIYAGTFTHNGEQLHYVYVKNPAGIEDALKVAYRDACSGCQTSTILKDDASWEAYLKFLYPNQAIVEHQPSRPEGWL